MPQGSQARVLHGPARALDPKIEQQLEEPEDVAWLLQLQLQLQLQRKGAYDCAIL